MGAISGPCRRTLSERSESKGKGEKIVAYVYILECQDNWLYVGCTNHLLRRWAEHKQGGSRFTKTHPPKRVIHVEPFTSRSQAEQRERQLKRWTRAKKRALAAGDFDLLKRL